MNTADLNQRIATWEDLYTEFKAWPINPATCAESLVAFANSAGGQLILGVAHVTRNPMIYTLFSRLGLVTGIGSGIYRTIQLVKAAVGREPDLRVEGNEFVVTLPRKLKGE